MMNASPTRATRATLVVVLATASVLVCHWIRATVAVNGTMEYFDLSGEQFYARGAATALGMYVLIGVLMAAAIARVIHKFSYKLVFCFALASWTYWLLVQPATAFSLFGSGTVQEWAPRFGSASPVYDLYKGGHFYRAVPYLLWGHWGIVSGLLAIVLLRDRSTPKDER